MAPSNKEKVGRGLEVLAEGLKPFVEEHMNAALPNGTDWLAAYNARESARDGAPRNNSTDDVRFLLRILTEDWRVFASVLSRQHSNLASELRDVGNRWAHNSTMSSDDTYRALDTTERLLTAINEPDLAQQVGRMRINHQRGVFDEQTRQSIRAAASTIAVPGSQSGTAIKPWRDVIVPHDDVIAGQFNAAEYAADLFQVANGQTEAQEYTNPREFFARTYLTSGLEELLQRAVKRISGDLNASPVMNLQTQFGGGKTHSMLALYHLFSGVASRELPQAVQEIVSDALGTDDSEVDPLARLKVKRVTLVGTHLSPSEPLIKDDGTEVRTLWGEIAWQLGGREAFDRIAHSDASGVPPGDALAQIVRDHSPALILIDEWVAYARLLVGRDNLAGGDFASQFTFAQHLTELVRAIPGAMLIVSIPASDKLDSGGDGSALEAGGENGRITLERLQHVVGRTADDWRPATALESFEIVKRRLFVEPDAAARTDIAAVARQYVNFYREHKGQFPREAETSEYEARIKAAYPIHPELFDRLYEDWSTLEKFQRTRGVLRLMSGVINALWSAGDASPLIAPGTVPLNAATVGGELTRYLSDAWTPIIDTDIDGEGSTPVSIDAERPSFGARALTRRIARATFLASAPTLRTAHKGVERQRLWLGVAVPGDTPAHFGDSLEVLSQRATYLYAESGRYWYDTTASISRQATDRADQLRESPEEVWAEIIKRLHNQKKLELGNFAGIHIAPSDTGDVPDVDEARLVVVHPRTTHGKELSKAKEFAEDLLARAGNSQRKWRNMLVLIAPTALRYEELDAAVREYLAWSWIAGAVEELNLTDQQRKQAETRAKQADETVNSRIIATYKTALIPTQPDPREAPSITTIQISEGGSPLAKRVSDKLRSGDELSSHYAPVNVRFALDGPLASVWANGHIAFGDLWALHAQYPYLSRLRDRSVLEDAVLAISNSLMWQAEGFALAAGYDEEKDRYDGLWLPGDPGEPVSLPDSHLLVAPARAVEQRTAEIALAEAARAALEAGGSTATGGVSPETPGTPAANFSEAPADEHPPVSDATSRTGPVVAPRPIMRRFFGTKELSPERYSNDFLKITEELIQHLSGVEGAQLEIRLEVTAVAPDGFTEDKVRTVRENATQLKFEQSGFAES